VQLIQLWIEGLITTKAKMIEEALEKYLEKETNGQNRTI